MNDYLKVVSFAECVANVFPGWIHLLSKNNMKPLPRIERTWDLMPRSAFEASSVLKFGHRLAWRSYV